MPVRMGVARAGRDRRLVDVLVVRIAGAVHMLVAVLRRLVPMPMFVPLRQVQRHAQRHQRARHQQWRR